MAFETSDTLPSYFRSIAKLKPLTVEQEHALADGVAAGDQEAIDTLVKHNLRIVIKIARRHLGQGVLLDDLIQEGNIGLYEAATRYKPTGTTRFTSYAQMWIRKRLNGAVVNTGRIVKLPANQEYGIYQSKMKGQPFQVNRRVEIDAPIADDSDTSLADRLLSNGPEIETQIEIDDLKFTVTRAISDLKARDQLIVKQYYGIDQDYAMSSEAIAERHGLTIVRVCQIIKSSLQKMRAASHHSVDDTIA
jgi:RNA polymerase primary sigma factor